jgi:hypothetical protein
MSSDKAYILPLTSNKRCQQHAAVWKCTIFLIIFVVVIASALGAAYFFMRGTHDGYKVRFKNLIHVRFVQSHGCRRDIDLRILRMLNVILKIHGLDEQSLTWLYYHRTF